MNRSSLTNISTYNPKESAAFMRSRERYGDLSNMTFGFRLKVQGMDFQSSEGLYQAMKFPHEPDVQRSIGAARSGMDAKRISNDHQLSMPEWEEARIDAMIITLANKLDQHRERFSRALAQTSGLQIVEKSYRDPFWGARPSPAGIVGANVLGKLLQELRCFLVQTNDPAEAARQFANLADNTGLRINGRADIRLG